MGNVRLVTDSTADIPVEVLEDYGIEMVPLKIQFGGETYFDRVTLSPQQFYEKLVQFTELPTTSQPSPVNFLEAYKRLSAEEGTQIVSVHLSSALSGTCQAAQLAKSLLEPRNTHIEIIDSKSASYGTGMLVVAAAEAAREGKSKEEIVTLIHRLRRLTKLYFLVDTLEYLQRGGRIGKASALIGSLLQLKPVLTIDDDGEVTVADKIRGHAKAIGAIIEKLKNDFPDKRIRVMIAHANARVEAEQFAALIEQHFPLAGKIGYTSIGPVIGTHVGPGTLGIFVSPAE